MQHYSCNLVSMRGAVTRVGNGQDTINPGSPASACPISDIPQTNRVLSLINTYGNSLVRWQHACFLEQSDKLCHVLILAGIELISFIVAGMGLCFGFVLETVLIIQGCFSYC